MGLNKIKKNERKIIIKNGKGGEVKERGEARKEKSDSELVLIDFSDID